jgi:UDP-N-acetylglucosamine transferase subunit ALG13
MIFVTVGTANKGFSRLIKECDDIANALRVEFFAQIGMSEYVPVHMAYTQWLTREQMSTYYKKASAYIVHGGFGTLSEIIRFGKPIIVVPRRFEDGEAVNNQNDLADKLNDLGFVKTVSNMSDLQSVISDIDSFHFKTYDLKSTVPNMLNKYISDLQKK